MKARDILEASTDLQTLVDFATENGFFDTRQDMIEFYAHSCRDFPYYTKDTQKSTIKELQIKLLFLDHTPANELEEPRFIKRLVRSLEHIHKSKLKPYVNTSDHKDLWYYFPDDESLERLRPIGTTPGRYINKIWPYFDECSHVKSYLTGHPDDAGKDNYIADISNDWRLYTTPAEVLFTKDLKTIKKVYREGPSACMSHPPSQYQSHDTPIAVYADSPDICLAFAKREDRIVARAIINENEGGYVRIYGNSAALEPALEKKGWLKEVSLEGCHVQKIEHSPGVYMLPYFDGPCYDVDVDPNNGNLFVLKFDGHWRGRSTSGLSNRFLAEPCPHCGAVTDSDSMVHVNDYPEIGSESSVCRQCAFNSGYFVTAVGASFNMCVPRKHIYKTINDIHYTEGGYNVANFQTCEVTNELFPAQNCNFTRHGIWRSGRYVSVEGYRHFLKQKYRQYAPKDRSHVYNHYFKDLVDALRAHHEVFNYPTPFDVPEYIWEILIENCEHEKAKYKESNRPLEDMFVFSSTIIRIVETLEEHQEEHA